MTAADGICHFYSETGTEGGYWAFYDPAYTTPNLARRCARCGTVDDPAEAPDATIHVVRSYDAAEVADPDWVEPPACDPADHDWEPMYPNGMWSYEGLHVLETGDRLTIFERDDPERVAWSGEVDLTESTVYTEHVAGAWIHNRQRGVDLERWAEFFFAEYPARLERRAGG